MVAKIEFKMEFWIDNFHDQAVNKLCICNKKNWHFHYLYKNKIMSAKSRKKSKKKTNSLWIFLAVIIAIAIISMTFSYFWIEQDKPEVLLLPNTEQDQKTVEPTKKQLDFATPIEGIWVSNYDGVMLTITGLTFTLESSGVDETQKIKGDLSIEENIVTFVYTSGSEVCKGPEGHYLYSIDGKDELFFKLIKDICDGRKERMTASWFKL